MFIVSLIVCWGFVWLSPRFVTLYLVYFLVLCLSFILSCLCLVALWSPAGKELTSLTLLYVMFSCDCVTFPYYVLGQVWYLAVWFPDLSLHPYFSLNHSAGKRELMALVFLST